MRPLAEQSVLVTGAAQGLGAAIARAFAAAGSRLLLVDFNSEGLAGTAADCGADCQAIVLDLTDSDRTAAALGGLGPVDTLVHNAAILEEKPFGEMTLGDFTRTVDVGLTAGFQLARAVWPGMVARGGGALIFVSSRSGIEGFANETAYCAAKHGLEGLSKCLALEGTAYAIASITVTPGMLMHTPMSERTYDTEKRKRWVSPNTLTPGVLYLATDGLAHSGSRQNLWDLRDFVPSSA